MRKIWIAFIGALGLLVLSALPSAAQQQPMGVVANCWDTIGLTWKPCQLNPSLNPSAAPYPFTPLSPMQSGLGVASATALTIPSGATYAVICARTQNVNYSTDGTTTPTASVGMQLQANQCVSVQGAVALANFRAIQQAATATLDVSYFK